MQESLTVGAARPRPASAAPVATGASLREPGIGVVVPYDFEAVGPGQGLLAHRPEVGDGSTVSASSAEERV
ncbi:hypothetical protein [Serinicoccus marinus]|uniref:hypothetical protein n=1 Tax=Serinicoccus marinus TaxID=247333 RepID=UPI0024907480|nr:hypothetical protein [Serinicoccus marinus]